MNMPLVRRFGTRTRISVLLAACAGALLLLVQWPAGAITVGGTPIPVTGNATYFDGLGQPYGGCGIPQANLDSQNFVALNVFNTPGDYSYSTRPVPASDSGKIGMWDNGLNCGRFVQVTIGDYCTGTNDGAQNQAFCRNGSWTADGYNGAALTMEVADSCGDSNAWCRDDPYHLDLAKNSLNLFQLNGTAVGDMYPNHWNNRHISWQFVAAPNYSGDIGIGFLQGAQTYWGAIAITHLANGIHGVDYYSNGTWTSAKMDSDQGQTYITSPITTGGTQFEIRVYDSNDQLINNGRTYTFSIPSACGSSCGAAYTATTYTTSDGGSSPSPSPSVTATTGSPSPSPSATSASPSPSPTLIGSPSSPPSSTAGSGKSCTATYSTVSSWQGGFQASVTVANTGTTATNGWQVTITNPSGESITQLWNGTVSTGGSVSTVTNASYNGAISVGGNTSFGYTGSATGTVTAPTVNCSAT
jgi:hypothetical protein